ncbi:DUF397 domain-containing protein [Kibdelosporangium aridum]|uniref:DUF397 domain-containing protein n=1 Tax=Kibdelosporangium aridum TaxID=2030 RepID=UPI0035EAB29A
MTINLEWRKSSFSGDQNACVELAVTIEHTHVRDSKRPESGALAFERSAFRMFVNTLAR